MSERPELDLTRAHDAQVRFEAAIADLDDGEIDRPSLLPGWTIGHVLTHVARNADSHRRRALAAERHEMVDQYEGGFAGRAAAIDEGAGRRADEIIADVKASALALEETWGSVPDSAWPNITRDVGGRERPLYALPRGVGRSSRFTSPTWEPVRRTQTGRRISSGSAYPSSGPVSACVCRRVKLVPPKVCSNPRGARVALRKVGRPGLPVLSAWS